jgi:peptidyl-prolyl cis-trans isomerase-like 4
MAELETPEPNPIVETKITAEEPSQMGDESIQLDDSVEAAEAAGKRRREREARAQALTLEIVGDLPFAEVKPPENVLFVCKLNPVTQGMTEISSNLRSRLMHAADDDLELIFSRFGKIISCEVIKDKRTKESLQYAFIEYENQKDCEQAYFKMQGVLIDDHRIHVDFSQSVSPTGSPSFHVPVLTCFQVSRLSDTWRKVTNSKRAKQGGGFGGISGLEKKRQYKAMDTTDRDRGYGMVFDKNGNRRPLEDSFSPRPDRQRSRSRSPPRHKDREYRDDRREKHSHDRYRDRRYDDRRNFEDYRDRDRR